MKHVALYIYCLEFLQYNRIKFICPHLLSPILFVAVLYFCIVTVLATNKKRVEVERSNLS
jgi:hypothetical protein